MKYFLFSLLFVVLGQVAFSQVTYPISSYDPTTIAFKNLLLTNQQIEDNDTINEEIVDLVTPTVLDSVLARKREHHQVFLVGWIIHTFGGYGWRNVNMTKQKFVGTIKGESRSGEEQYTEYDINYNLYFHTRKYLNKIFLAYDYQKKIGRQDFLSKIRHPRDKVRKNRYKEAPFVRDTNNTDMYLYRLHCELTPDRKYRNALHYLFYPTLPGVNIDRHPNFMHTTPTMGFYGAHCLDCNHSCHPEIHPYEWAWWMNLHNGTEKDKTWVFGLFKEGSNRFHHWSHNPKSGKVSIPFSYHVTDPAAKDRVITVEHLVFGRFIDSNLTKLNMPPTVFNTDQKSVMINLTGDKGLQIPLTVNFRNVMVGSGVRYWFSDVNWDEQNHILSGFMNFATSVEDVYTVKLTFAGQ